jgi:hypothetical protein
MGDTMTVMRFEADGRALRVDFGKPVSIAIPLDFAGPQPAAFGAPRAESRPLRVGGFVGDMRAGGSCNCEVLTLAPHCNGTHTECVGHVTDALLVTVEPAPAEHSGEDTDPRPAPGDRLVTAAALERAAVRHAGPRPAALVVRTAAGDGPHREYRGPAPAPYLSRQAAAWLVERGIEALVLDLPSADRADDGGRLTAHRIFFGLPPGSRDAAAARRPGASITELAWIGPEVADGYYLLDLQIPPFVTDAAPSRPLLYPVEPA